MTEIPESVHWGFPTLIHFFLAGVGGGALAISSLLLLLSGRRPSLFGVARFGAFIAPVVVLDDAVVLILELGRPSRFLNIFRHVNVESPLWVGSWLMLIFLVVSILYAFTFLSLPKRQGATRTIAAKLGVAERVGPDDERMPLRRAAALAGIPLGLAVSHYPGFMMSGLVARPLWSTAMLPTVTLLSSLATATAAIILCRILFARVSRPEDADTFRDDSYLLMSTNVALLIAEAFVFTQIILYARNARGDLQLVIDKVIVEGGLLATEFWWGAVGLGFVLPVLAGLMMIGPRLIFSGSYDVPRPVEAIMPTAALAGSLVLIYVLLFGGQLTSPMGL